MTTKMMTTKHDKRGGEAGAPANLTHNQLRNKRGMMVQQVAVVPGNNRHRGRCHCHTATLWRWVKRMTKTMTSKRNRRGREAGAPASLMQQLTKEKEGHDGVTSGGGARRRCNERGGRVAGALVNATPKKLRRGAQWRDKRGREVGALGNVT